MISQDISLFNTDHQNDNLNELEESNLINRKLIVSSQEATSSQTNQIDQDNYINQMLSEEDFQIIGFQDLQTNLPVCLVDDFEEIPDSRESVNLDLINEDHIEVSSDSAISSMSRSVS